MWPDWVNRLLSSGKRPYESTSPVTPGLVDTLRMVAGKPRGEFTVGGIWPGSGGSYMPGVDVMDRSPESTVHEYGHRLGATSAQARRQFMASVRSKAAPDSYASTNKDEHFAEAFSQAFDAVQYVSSKDFPYEHSAKNAAKVREQMEKALPGSSGLLDFLVSQPMFNSSWLAQYPRPLDAVPAAQQDATRTRGTEDAQRWLLSQTRK